MPSGFTFDYCWDQGYKFKPFNYTITIFYNEHFWRWYKLKRRKQRTNIEPQGSPINVQKNIEWVIKMLKWDVRMY